MTTPNRREALGSMLTLAGFAVLSGCASGGKKTTGAPPVLPPDEGLADGGIPNGNRGQELLDQWNRRKAGGTVASTPSGVMPRSQWTRQGPIVRLSNPMGRVTRITIHHDGMNAFTSTQAGDAAGRLESIRKAHTGQGWADIGYHFAIDPAGRVWEGRPLSLQGAHVKDNNEQNLGILVLGNHNDTRPTSAAIATLGGFVSSQMRRFGVPVQRVYTHQELKATECPGVHLQRQMLDLRSSRGVLARA